jgi:hypothetical protein
MTDNGSNFVKVFVQFGTEAEFLPNFPGPAADSDMEGVDDVDTDVDPEAGSMDEVEYISIEATLEGDSGLGHNLPVHMKCAAHTFNLVASVDVNKVLDSA